MRLPAFIQNGSAQIKPVGQFVGRTRIQAHLNKCLLHVNDCFTRRCKISALALIIHVNPPLSAFYCWSPFTTQTPPQSTAPHRIGPHLHKSRLRKNRNPIRSISVSNGFITCKKKKKKLRCERLKLYTFAWSCTLSPLNHKELQ